MTTSKSSPNSFLIMGVWNLCMSEILPFLDSSASQNLCRKFFLIRDDATLLIRLFQVIDRLWIYCDGHCLLNFEAGRDYWVTYPSGTCSKHNQVFILWGTTLTVLILGYYGKYHEQSSPVCKFYVCISMLALCV